MKASAGMLRPCSALAALCESVFFKRIGSVGKDHACGGFIADCPIFGIRQAVAADELRLDRDVVQLTGEKAAFRMIAAEIDDIDAGRLELRRQRAVILFARGQESSSTSVTPPALSVALNASARPLP